MKQIFEIEAQDRSDMGKGASRRLRRQGLVPGLLYGARREPRLLSMSHTDLIQRLEHEAFYSHVLTLKIGDQTQEVILKDLQRHPAKPFVQHVDFLRVRATEKLRTNVPIHLLNETTAVGVKLGGAVARHIPDVEIICLPKDLPEFIEIDIAEMDMGDTVMLSELKLPAGVELYAAENDLPVVSVHSGYAEQEEVEEGEEGEEEAPVVEE
mgnify:FL=1